MVRFALIAAALAAPATALADDAMVLRIPAAQVVHMDDYGIQGADTQMRQLSLQGELGSLAPQLEGWLADWANHRMGQVDATVEFMGADGEVLRRVELNDCVPYRYNPAIMGAQGEQLSASSFYFSGELAGDADYKNSDLAVADARN